MNILIKDNIILAESEHISFGIFDEPFKKWRIADTDDNTRYYMIDDGFTLIENVTLPPDYINGKYFFENSEFVLNEDWKPYVPSEERISILEAENAQLKAEVEAQAEALDFLLMQ